MGCGIGNGCLHFRRSAPSLAGRSPQRDWNSSRVVRERVGEGVALAILLQLQNRPPRGGMRERSPQFPPIGSLPLQGRAGVGLTDSGVDVVEITRVGAWRHIERIWGGLHCAAGMQANPTPSLPHRGRGQIGAWIGLKWTLQTWRTPTPTLSRCGRWRVLQGRG